MVATFTDALNWFNSIGGFSYIVPFLLIFSVVFAILLKSKVLSAEGNDNRGILSIVAASVGLLALQFDFVSDFFANIFPRFGVGIAVFLVLLIMLGFFYPMMGKDKKPTTELVWIGWLVGIGVVLWSFSSWNFWGFGNDFSGWFGEYIWSLIVLGVVIAAIFFVASSGKAKPAAGS